MDAPAPLVVLAPGEPAPAGSVVLDLGSSDREATAVLVAAARLRGVEVVRTSEPVAARRAAHVVDAVRAAP